MKGYRTVLTALAMVLVGMALVILLPDHADAGIALILSGVSMAGLRAVTDGPVGGSGKE